MTDDKISAEKTTEANRRHAARQSVKVAALYGLVCAALYAAAIASSLASKDADIGSGFLAILPSMPWFFVFFDGSSSHTPIIVGYVLNTILAATGTFVSLKRKSTTVVS